MRLKSPEKEKLFTELFELKDAKAELDKRIKEIEKQYKPDLDGLKNDIFYELDNGVRFSIKTSKRKGGYDSKLVDKFITDKGFMTDDFKKDDTVIHTLRKDK